MNNNFLSRKIKEKQFEIKISIFFIKFWMTLNSLFMCLLFDWVLRSSFRIDRRIFFTQVAVMENSPAYDEAMKQAAIVKGIFRKKLVNFDSETLEYLCSCSNMKTAKR